MSLFARLIVDVKSENQERGGRAYADSIGTDQPTRPHKYHRELQ